MDTPQSGGLVGSKYYFTLYLVTPFANRVLAQHYDFYIYNYMASTEFMDPNGCITYLGDEINGCQYGGDSTYNFGTSYWRFM